MADILPDLSDFCFALSTGPGELCIEMPGGARLCAQAGFDTGDLGEITKSLFAQINSALAPLQPFFNILDVLKCIMDCIMAIPDCIGPPPDPSGLLNCIPNLQKAVDKLLKLLPQLSIPIMIKSILHTIIVGLQGVRLKLLALIKQVERIIAASLKATALGNLQLQIVVDCANNNMDAQLQNLNAGMAPLNRLLGLMNVLCELAGLPCIPPIGGLAAIGEDALAPLDAIIKILQALEAAIPVPDLSLPAFDPDADCA